MTTNTASIEKVSAAAPKARPTVEELVGRARDMIPVLRERGAKADQARRISDETVADFVKAGFHNIGQPRRFGGMGYGQDVISKVGSEVARGDGTSGWLACFFGVHNMMIG